MLGAPPGRACRLPGVPQAAQRTRCGTVHGVRTGSHPFPASCSRTHRAVRRTGLARRERDPGYADPPRSLPDPLEQGAPRRCSRLRPAYRRAPGGVGASGASPGHGRAVAARGEQPHRTRPTERSHGPRAPGAGAADPQSMCFSKVDEREGVFLINIPDFNALRLPLIQSPVSSPTVSPAPGGSSVISPTPAPAPK